MGTSKMRLRSGDQVCEGPAEDRLVPHGSLAQSASIPTAATSANLPTPAAGWPPERPPSVLDHSSADGPGARIAERELRLRGMGLRNCFKNRGYCRSAFP